MGVTSYANSMVNPSLPQTAVAGFTGVDESNGLFKIHYATRYHGLFAKSTQKHDWWAFLVMPDPSGGPDIEYPWLYLCGSLYLLNNDEWVLPKDSKIKIMTSNVDGAQLTAQINTSVYKERH